MTNYPLDLPQDERLETLFALLPEMSQETARAVLICVIEVYGSERIKIEMRNIQVMNEYDGRNISQLCRKYRITRRSFYLIREKDLARSRGD